MSEFMLFSVSEGMNRIGAPGCRATGLSHHAGAWTEGGAGCPVLRVTRIHVNEALGIQERTLPDGERHTVSALWFGTRHSSPSPWDSGN